jgi:hypothetical protein
MRKWFVGLMVALAAVLSLSLLMRAQGDRNSRTTKNGNALPDGPHDFSGVWDPAPFMQPKGEVNPLDLGGHPNPLPPFTAWGKEKYEANAQFIAAGAVLDCDPFGTARNYFTPRPFEIIQARDRLVQHWEYYDNWREIWTDGRKIPADVEPDYMGYSIGKWEGDVFVVESAAYNGKQFLTWQGFPISESMHQTERWERVSPDTLKIVFTFDDPKSYTQPWGITFFYKLKKDWMLDAHPCTLSAIKEYDEKMNHRDKLLGRDYKPQN